MAEQYFLLENKDEYQRELDPVMAYIKQASFYLHIQTGKDIKTCTDIVKRALKDKEKFPNIQNPLVIYYQRQDNGDKNIRETSLTSYIKDIVTKSETIAPSFTSYTNSSHEASMISKFAMNNVAMRSKVKKEMFKAKALGNVEKALDLDLKQKLYKTNNNALSGALVSNGSVVKNPSGHSSLTSTTRTVTSLGNASNERLIAGNRHYRHPDIVVNNIISICSRIDEDLIRQAIAMYHLVYPTVDDAMECILRSTRFYWHDNSWEDRFRSLLSKLQPVHLAAFVYIGDLYHIRKFNPDMVQEFLDQLCSTHISSKPLDQVKDDISKYDDVTTILARLSSFDDLKGNKTTILTELDEPILRKIEGTCQHIEETLSRYSLFIKAFFVTSHIPPSVAYISDMIRKTVVLSDTDSTCASYGEWVKWRYKHDIINSQGIAYSAAVMTIGTQSIAHTLATLSANIGVSKDNLRRLAMKNEFLWTIFCPANISKTYFASTMVQEGVIFPEYDLEYKGVQYKSANSPKVINDLIKECMRYVIDSITSTGKYSLNYLLNKVYTLEKDIVSYIDNKDPRALEYFNQLNIKEATAYALEPYRSNYSYHLLWEEVFEPYYGYISPPPYRSIKIPLDISNKTDLKNWIESIENKDLASRLLNYLVKYNKQDIKLICLPMDYVRNNGIPKEIRSILSIERLLQNTVKGLYLLLESLGFTHLDGQSLISSHN